MFYSLFYNKIINYYWKRYNFCKNNWKYFAISVKNQVCFLSLALNYIKIRKFQEYAKRVNFITTFLHFYNLENIFKL